MAVAGLFGERESGEQVNCAALTCFVSFPARARRKPSAANLAPAAERGRRRFSVLANRWRRGGGGAGGELDDELPGRLERQADRPIGCLAPLDVLALQFWWPPAAGEPD